MAEANAAGAPAQPPAPEDGLPPPATGDAVMEIEDDEEPEQMKIVRDYKRPEHRHAHAIHLHPARSTRLPEQATPLSSEMRIFGSPGQLKRLGLLAMTGFPEQRRERSLLPASLTASQTECDLFCLPHLHAADIRLPAESAVTQAYLWAAGVLHADLAHLCLHTKTGRPVQAQLAVLRL